jgi:DNA invertase Pin-like site-specific DNA recombinase
MKPQPPKKPLRCAIYTRKSTEHNLDLEFNSLDAQREACEAYIKSQAHEGWRLVRARYDDGGLSGASLDRPALQELLADVRDGEIDVIVYRGVDLRSVLRAYEANELLYAAIDEAISRKPKGHDFIIDRRHRRPALARHMSVTGG